jgi:hypothetical protein
MAETYDSVLDRIGAFNAATEGLSKGRLQELRVEVNDDVGLRLAATSDGYNIDVLGAPDGAAEMLEGLGFRRSGEGWTRDVRKSERSWNVASQLEDVLQEALGLGPNGRVSIS